MIPYKSDGNERDVRAPWIQILRLPAGSPVLSVDGQADIPLTGLFMIPAPPKSPFSRIKATPGVFMLIGEWHDQTAPVGAPVATLDTASGFPQFIASLKGGLTFLPTLIAAGSTSGVVGADFNSADWLANQTRVSTWIDVNRFAVLVFIQQVLGRADTLNSRFEWSIDGTQAVGTQDGESGLFGAGLVPVQPNAGRNLVMARFVRISVTKGAVAGPHTVRLSLAGVAV